MDNKTESFEEGFDLRFKQKQCQCAKVNPSNIDMERIERTAKIKTKLELSLEALSGDDDEWSFDTKPAQKLIREAIDLIRYK